MISKEIKLKNEAEKGTQSVDYETEMQKILDGYDAERQKNIIDLLKKLVGSYQPVPPKEFAAVSLIRYDTPLAHSFLASCYTSYFIIVHIILQSYAFSLKLPSDFAYLIFVYISGRVSKIVPLIPIL